MYEAFYGLNRKPFSLTPDPDFLYLGKQHAVAMAMLEYGLTNQAGFTLITGEIGAGKTTMIRYLLKHITQDCTVGVITNTHQKFGDLLSWILWAFGLDTGDKDKVTMYERLVDFVAQQHANGSRVVLIVDEAQNMDTWTLEELRLLSNINITEQVMLQLILVGQPELSDILASNELRQLAQRISVEHHVNALDFNETRNYINHRVTVAGGKVELFDRYALAAIDYYCRGIPRSINNICDMCLVYGFAEEQTLITVDLVLDVIRAKRIIRQLIAAAKPDTDRERLREMVLEIKGVDIAMPELAGS
ncbi:MAG: AAA family ATPase [Gammaproteobacteria bacterium]|nr:AAA family ATPase [Gammaproteobacteria bacterium]